MYKSIEKKTHSKIYQIFFSSAKMWSSLKWVLTILKSSSPLSLSNTLITLSNHRLKSFKNRIIQQIIRTFRSESEGLHRQGVPVIEWHHAILLTENIPPAHKIVYSRHAKVCWLACRFPKNVLLSLSVSYQWNLLIQRHCCHHFLAHIYFFQNTQKHLFGI